MTGVTCRETPLQYREAYTRRADMPALHFYQRTVFERLLDWWHDWRHR